MKTSLPRFENRTPSAAAIALSGKAHDRVGALAYDEEVFLIVRARVTFVAHGDTRVNGADVFTRKHTLKADAVELLEADEGKRMLAEAEMLADERFGVPNLFNQGEAEMLADERFGVPNLFNQGDEP